jgi:hypothetical protein
METKIKILFLSAGADEESWGRLAREAREIGLRLRASEGRDSFELVTEWAVRASDLQRCLLQHRPHIVHLGGLTTEAGDILLSDDGGNPRPVDSSALAELFTILEDNIRVVVLSAPGADGLARQVARTVDYVISLGGAVAGQTVVTFSAHFYQGLGYARTAADAFRLARNQLMLDGSPDYEKPLLHVRDGAGAAPT